MVPVTLTSLTSAGCRSAASGIFRAAFAVISGAALTGSLGPVGIFVTGNFGAEV